jgi:hypothetical protein
MVPKLDAIVKGHLNQQHQNIRSAQPVPDVDDPTLELEQEGKCHAIYEAVCSGRPSLRGSHR